MQERTSGEAWEGAVAGRSLGELLAERNDVRQSGMEKALRIRKPVGGELGPLAAGPCCGTNSSGPPTDTPRRRKCRTSRSWSDRECREYEYEVVGRNGFEE